jgi:hypothetical protein
MTNKLGDLLRDLRNPDTSQQRLDEIVRLFNELSLREEKYKSWLSFADSNPKFNMVYARDSNFEISPIEGMLFERTPAAILSVPNNTETAVAYTRYTSATSLVHDTPETLTTGKIGIGQKFDVSVKIIGVVGGVEWANNANGRRAVTVNLYDEADVFLAGVTLASTPPTGVDVDTLPYAGVIHLPGTLGAVSLKMNVFQNSGGALNMNFFRVAFFAVR